MIKNVLIAFLFISLVACKSKAAFDYSEEFVRKEQSLGPDIQKAEADVSAFNIKEQYDSIAVIGARMEKLFDIKLKEIEKEPAPDVKEGENFKKAGILYFKYLKSIYTNYKDYGNAKIPEERQQAVQRIKDNLAFKDNAIADITEAQQKFAKANGFKIKQ